MDRERAYRDDFAFLARYSPPELAAYLIHVSLKFRYIYFEVPKTGCSTLKRFLIRNESPDIDVGGVAGIDDDELVQAHDRSFSPLLFPRQVYPISGKLGSGRYFRFCFVRNPYSRLLSAFLQQVCGAHGYGAAHRRAFGLGDGPPTPDLFGRFVAAVAAQDIAGMDAHWKPQFHLTCQDAVQFDFIGRFETLDRDIGRLAEGIGLDLALLERFAPHATGSDGKLDAYYTPALRRRVAQVYAADFDAFGYPP